MLLGLRLVLAVNLPKSNDAFSLFFCKTTSLQVKLGSQMNIYVPVIGILVEHDTENETWTRLVYHKCLEISLCVAGGESDCSSKGIIGIASSTRTMDTYFLILVSNSVVLHTI